MGRNVNYFITGATGFIGRALIGNLCASDKMVHIFALVRDEQKAKVVLDEYTSQITFIEDSLEALLTNGYKYQNKIDYIIHCAAPTQSVYMISNPIETFESIAIGTRNVLEFARRQNVKGMVYLSSMEAYGVVEDIGRPRNEQEIGEIDLLSVRSCYPLGKRVAEHYCYLYHQQYNVPVKIARLAQVFGNGVRKDDGRVFMQFVKAIIDEEDIVLKTDGSSMGNYCATEDAIQAIMTILENGKNGEVYNVVNEANTMRIREMADLVAMHFGNGKTKVLICEDDHAKTGYASKTGLRMSAQKLRALGWKPTKALLEMYRDIFMD